MAKPNSWNGHCAEVIIDDGEHKTYKGWILIESVGDYHMGDIYSPPFDVVLPRHRDSEHCGLAIWADADTPVAAHFGSR